MSLYSPSFFFNSLCFPCWIIEPFCITIIVSHSLIVERRCAILIIVIPSLLSFLSMFSSSNSLNLSRLLVASSNISIFGLYNRALANTIFCFSPPLKPQPCSPSIVLYFFGNCSIKKCAPAFFEASIISSKLASGCEKGEIVKCCG